MSSGNRREAGVLEVRTTKLELLVRQLKEEDAQELISIAMKMLQKRVGKK